MTHWASVQEATNVAGIRLLLMIHAVLGRWAFRLAAWPVAGWYALIRRDARAASLDYLSRVYAHSGGRTQRPSLWGVIRHMAAFAESLLDKLLVWGGRIEQIPYRVEGEGVIQAALARGRGCLVITAHVGNFELTQRLASRFGVKCLNVLIHSQHTARFNALAAPQRGGGSLNLLPVQAMDPVMAADLARRVDAGELVAIAGDRVPLDASSAVIQVPFLGSPARFPMGPYILASILDCPVIAIFATRQREGYLIRVQAICAPLEQPRRERQERARPYARQFVAALEAQCVAAPLQWFNFFDFWS